MEFRLVIFGLSILVSFSLLGQFQWVDNVQEIKDFVHFEKKLEDLEKSNDLGEFAEIMLMDNWGNMIVYLKNGEDISLDSSNYCILTDQIYRFENGELMQFYTHLVDYVKIGDYAIKSFNHKKNKKEVNAHFQVLADGNIMLLKRYDFDFRALEKSHLDHWYNRKADILTEDYYYYNLKRKKLEKLPNKKSKIAKIFGKNKKKVIEYAEKMKIDSNSDEGLEQIFVYYNQLPNEEK